MSAMSDASASSDGRPRGTPQTQRDQTPSVFSSHAVAPRPQTVVFTHSGRDWIRGSEQCLLDLVAALPRERFSPVVVCDAPTLAREARATGAVVERIGEWGTGFAVAADIRRRLADIFADVDASLVHANMALTVPAVLPVARARRLPLVAHLHLAMPDQAERLHSLVHQANVIVGVAEHVVTPFRKDGLAVSALRVIPNAVAADRMERGDASDLRNSLGIDRDALVCASVGSLIPRKGHDVLVEAVALLRAAQVDVHALICGDGEAAADLRALARTRGIGDAVHFLGLRDDVGSVLRYAADLYVTGARDEALPLNVLEAQWMGVPVIASAISAHGEAVREGVTGLLFPSEDAAALAAAVHQLAADPERRRQLGAAGQAFARSAFAMERYVSSFVDLYSELLARPRRLFGWAGSARWPSAYSAWAGRVIARRIGLRA